jgi:ppGpp synthetase/RelA/SpoT-type nucleotidyltranferase
VIVPPAVQQRFTETKPYLDSLKALVGDTIEPWAEEKGFAYHSRVKEVQSVAEKIETGRYASWAHLDDLVAGVIVIPTHSHEQAVIDFLEARFVTDDLRKRGPGAKPPDVFRFDSTRWYGRLRPHNEGLRPEIDALLFEIQVRSAFEHAWNVTTHDLAYKGQMIEWRRARLVAQVKAAVEQIDMLIDGFEKSAELLQDFPWRELEQQARLRECFLRKLNASLIDNSLAPKDWTRFAQNLLALIFASAPSRRRRDEHFDACLTALQDHNEELPLSCSLLQSALGILAEAGLLIQIEGWYAPLITPELERFFGACGGLGNRFTLA